MMMKQTIFIEDVYSSAVLRRNPHSSEWEVVSPFVSTLNAVRFAFMESVKVMYALVVVERHADAIVVVNGRIVDCCWNGAKVIFVV